MVPADGVETSRRALCAKTQRKKPYPWRFGVRTRCRRARISYLHPSPRPLIRCLHMAASTLPIRCERTPSFGGSTWVLAAGAHWRRVAPFQAHLMAIPLSCYVSLGSLRGSFRRSGRQLWPLWKVSSDGRLIRAGSGYSGEKSHGDGCAISSTALAATCDSGIPTNRPLRSHARSEFKNVYLGWCRADGLAG